METLAIYGLDFSDFEGLGVYGLGFRDEGLGFGAFQSFGIWIWIWVSGIRVQGLGLGVESLPLGIIDI